MWRSDVLGVKMQLTDEVETCPPPAAEGVVEGKPAFYELAQLHTLLNGSGLGDVAF